MKTLEFISTILDYKVYRNAEGFLEGYKSKGKMRQDESFKDLDRIVTNQTTEAGFEKFVKGMRKKGEKKIDKSTLPKLFNESED